MYVHMSWIAPAFSFIFSTNIPPPCFLLSVQPVFLRRNLSYSATHQERTERDQKATSIVHLHLEALNAPAGYSNSITVIAAVCAVLPGRDPDGQDAFVPLAAKVARVGLKPPGGPSSQHNGTASGMSSPSLNRKSLGVTLSMKVPFAQGTLPKDIVVVLLHKRKFTDYLMIYLILFISTCV